MDAFVDVPTPNNEPVLTYAPGTPERAELEITLARMAGEAVEMPHVIGGKDVVGSGEEITVVQPHAHAEVLGTLRDGTTEDAELAVTAALDARHDWQRLPFEERAAVFLKAAELLTGPWRARLNAATMLGQSKTAQQAEIDSACELADFWRFNVHYAAELLAEQPVRNAPGTWNRADHRPLEGFVYAVTPFNFTAIAGNLPTAPALMGNTVVWKPAPTQQRAATELMRLLQAAGLPDGVVNMVTGTGPAISDVVMAHPDFAGLHFTGSTAVFNALWAQTGQNLSTYRAYPRIVGETGGKDFIVAHPSADVDVLRTAMIRGAFEYQGQKCSAASRAYVPRSLWDRMRDDLVAETEGLTVGDVRDLSNFMGAVIDARAFAKHKAALDAARADEGAEIVAGGTYDDSEGYFVRPTIVTVEDPFHEMLRTEYFGPILAVHVYEDADWTDMLRQMESVAPYGLTGAVIAQDRAAVVEATETLRFAAGNFYVNDKPTGAVVGQQPFGGSRGSGTNDKAGSRANLSRWTSTRIIKETFVPPTDYRYPHMG
ncbi:L-glutamate gamma-semialdehyde dehydrogenase [Ornithinimicrobium humiphilum]|uniref:L-glutamate gamma-semialdehyde dehydrogenase n=1 Tax=Ornithinimicrobium humiphilum TaxID=125288 RepID=A0A543KMG4_9MICO|nr:L-glutamate gamma-semialdehyde dehydrogenase [Ornithinimicrobium humiphilum]TQM96268.1 delta-1-pyrroline-5-carboxylate dehydrogenase [Ornithinimicrobium humiphilum]